MKKSLLALATLTAFAGLASAQSSVTLFGVVDLAARNVQNGNKSLQTLSTDGQGSSRLGFRGVEDLGGGMRAGFWLEGSVAADVGGGAKTAATGANGNLAGGQDWQRRSTVSLMGGFGEIRLGRDYTPDFWNHTVFDPFGTNGVASSFNLFDTSGSGATTGVRANNSIGYFLPSGIGGLYGQVMKTLGEGRPQGNQHIGARIGYAAGPINVAVAFGKTKVEAAAPTFADADWKRINVGASWNLGFLTLMGQYITSETTGGLANKRSLDNYLVGATVPFGATTLKLSYIKSEGDGNTAAEKARDATQFGAGVQYSLSKRSSLYAHYSRVANKSGATWRASSGGIATAAGGLKSTGYEFGVNHTF